MKFSVVIPCHDRLNLLKEAIYTVLKQDWIDWELIVFDNASKNELVDYLEKLADPRVRYDRSEEFLPVTDSWNRAINMSTGDYVIFLGDDDGLTPNYFSRINPIIEKFKNPEILYSAIYQFIHPGVAPWAPEGYVADVKNGFFFEGKEEPFELSRKNASKAVRGSIKLRRNFTFNIQAFVFSQAFLNRLKQNGPIFQSPFPDYYIANIAFANAKSLVVIPEPLSIAGVSKASVGYTVFNGLEDRFSEILNTQFSQDPLYKNVEQFILPGSLYNSNYILTMEHVLKHASSFQHFKVDFSRYRRIQIYAHLFGNNTNKIELPYWERLSFCEKAWSYLLFKFLKLGKKTKLFSKCINFYLQRRVTAHTFQAITRNCNKKTYKELVEIFNDLHIGSLR